MEIPAKPRNSAPPDSGASTSAAALDQAAEVRFQQLKKVRMELASVENWPAFCICHDKVLREVARSAPNSLRSLAAIKGFGAKKAEKFGAAFLRALGQ
jgi:ATP-dependent DNA helicase RecQ